MLRYLKATALLLSLATPTLVLGQAPKKSGSGKTILKLKVEPPSQVFIDGKAKGSSAKLKDIEIAPGAHIVRVVHNRDEHEERVVLKKGETFEYQWKFEDDAVPKPKAASAEPEAEPSAEPDAPATGVEEPKMPSPPPERPRVEMPKRPAKTRAGAKDPLQDFQFPEYAKEKPIKTTSAVPVDDKAAKSSKTAQWTRGAKGSVPKSRASTAAKSNRRASANLGPNWKVASSTNK